MFLTTGFINNWDSGLFMAFTYDHNTGEDMTAAPLVGASLGLYKGGGRRLTDSALALQIRAGYRIYYARLVLEYTSAIRSDLPGVFSINIGFPIRLGGLKN